MIINLKSKRKIVQLTFIAISTFILYVIANGNGIRLTDDSHTYVACSCILQARGFWQILQEPLCPPLFTFFLTFLGNHLIFKTAIVNGILLMMNSLIFGLIGLQLIRSIYFQWFFLISLVFSADLLMVHSMLWSEPLFIFILSCQTYWLIRYMHHQRTKFILYVTLAGIALTLQRRTGIFINLAMVIAILSVTWRSKKVTLSPYLILLLAIIFSGLILWEIYLRFSTDLPETIFGLPDLMGFFPTTENYLNALSLWILPLPLPQTLRLIVALLVILVLVSGFIWVPHRVGRSLLLIWLSYFVLRLFWPRYDLDEAQRYLAVVYPLFALSFVIFIEYLTLLLQKQKRAIAIVILSIWLLYPVVRTVKNVVLYHNIERETVLWIK